MIKRVEPTAWIFYNIDGEIRFIIHDKQRMIAWMKTHLGEIVPLYKESKNSKAVAWAFYNPDGNIRFILDDEKRATLWAKHHKGLIIPLYK